MTTTSPSEHIPRDAFEAELFRRELERQCGWQRDGLPLRVGIGDRPDGAGRFELTIVPEPQTFNPRTYERDNRPVKGTCWLTEDDRGAPVARWHLPQQPMVAGEQENDARHTPSVEWS